ncbi:ROK family transcriptional regulator [Oscillospiraceae bacterium PP1C4]
MNNQTGKNLEDVQKMNRALIITFLQQVDVISRSELAEKSNLKQATITNIINDFIGWGLVEETGLITGKKGKRSIGLRLCKEKYKAVSVRFSRSYVHITVFDMGCKIYDTCNYGHDTKEEMKTTIETIIQEVKKLLKKYKNDKFLGVGVAMPGPWVKEKQKMVYFTGFYQWQDINIAGMMEKKLELPVYLEQDANLALLAESLALPIGNSNGTVLCVMVGQGIGAGIMTDGEILRGNLGIAGEIGHMSIQFDGEKCECGNIGCLEGFSSTRAVVNKVRSLAAEFPDTVLTQTSRIDDILTAYRSGDNLAVAVVNDSARYLGYALASLTNVINPGTIIIGDEMSKAGEQYLKIIIQSMKERIMPIVFENTNVVLSKFDLDPTNLGANYLVINESIQHPESFNLNTAERV